MAEATLKPHKNTIREGLEQGLGDFYRMLGYSDNYSRGVGASQLLENTTGLGAFTSGQDAQTSAGQGDWKGTAGNLAMAGLAAMPGGSEVKAGVKKVATDVASPAMQSMRDELARLMPMDARPAANIPQRDLPRYEPKKGTSGRVADLVANKDVKDKMLAGMKRGEEMGARDWYNMEPLRQSYIQELGKDEGPYRFDRLIDSFKGSSPRSNVPSNWRNASFYNMIDMQGLPLPEKNPYPYGHLAQNLHRGNFEKMRSGEGMSTFENPKVTGFGEDLKGNLRPVAVDTHAFRAPAILSQDPRFLDPALQGDKGTPTRNIQNEFAEGKFSMDEALARPGYWDTQPNKRTEYGTMERYYQDLAQEYGGGLRPGEAQALAWVGNGPLTGLKSDATKTAMDFFTDRLASTAIERNMDPKDVLRGMIRGEHPLLSAGAGAGAAGLGASILSQPPGDKKQEY